jgi:hypothetical protein
MCKPHSTLCYRERYHEAMRILSLLMVLAACEPPDSKNPLSDPAAAKPDPRLTGLWISHKNNEDSYLHVVPGKGATVDLVLVVPDKDKGAATLHFTAFPSVIGGKSYLNLRKKSFTDKWSDHFEVSPTYFFVRYSFAKDGALSLAYMDDDVVKQAIAAKSLAGEISPAVKITADSAALAGFIQKSTDPKLFSELETPFRKR